MYSQKFPDCRRIRLLVPVRSWIQQDFAVDWQSILILHRRTSTLMYLVSMVILLSFRGHVHIFPVQTLMSTLHWWTISAKKSRLWIKMQCLNMYRNPVERSLQTKVLHSMQYLLLYVVCADFCCLLMILPQRYLLWCTVNTALMMYA